MWHLKLLFHTVKLNWGGGVEEQGIGFLLVVLDLLRPHLGWTRGLPCLVSESILLSLHAQESSRLGPCGCLQGSGDPGRNGLPSEHQGEWAGRLAQDRNLSCLLCVPFLWERSPELFHILGLRGYRMPANAFGLRNVAWSLRRRWRACHCAPCGESRCTDCSAIWCRGSSSREQRGRLSALGPRSGSDPACRR